MSISVKDETRVACRDMMEKRRMKRLREESLALAEFVTEVRRVEEMVLLGVISDGTERRPLTIAVPV